MYTVKLHKVLTDKLLNVCRTSRTDAADYFNAPFARQTVSTTGNTEPSSSNGVTEHSELTLRTSTRYECSNISVSSGLCECNIILA